MILVTGAGGKTGNAVLRALVAKSVDAHAFVRTEAHIAAIKALGVPRITVGSMADLTALRRAAKAARAVYHICPNVSPFELDFAQAAITTAADSGVRRFVFHSVLHPQVEAMPHHWAKMRVEEALFLSDLDVTILQPAVYMQNILALWSGIVEEGVFRVPYPIQTRLSLVDLDDVAQAAALVLSEPGHVGATYELIGTKPLSQVEIAETLGRALGRSVRVEAETIETWRLRARASGLGDYQCDVLAKMFRYYADNGLVGNPNVLRWLLGRPPTTLAEFAVRAAASQASRLSGKAT